MNTKMHVHGYILSVVTNQEMTIVWNDNSWDMSIPFLGEVRSRYDNLPVLECRCFKASLYLAAVPNATDFSSLYCFITSFKYLRE